MRGRGEQQAGPGLLDTESWAYRSEVFAHLVEREVRRALRYQEFLVVLALNLAHPGDEGLMPPALLRLVADHIHEEVRATDLVGRWGDGLAVALVCTSKDDARAVASRLLARVQGLTQSAALPPPGAAPVRIGGACFPQSGSDAQSLLRSSLVAVQRAAETPGGGVWIGA